MSLARMRTSGSAWIDLGQVNRLTLAYRPTLAFLEGLVGARPTRSLRIVDVGSGGGDMLRCSGAMGEASRH